MKLTIIGGGGFRVPQIFEAVSGEGATVAVTELCLFDSHPERVAAIESVLAQLAPSLPRPPRITNAPGLQEALTGASFIFSAMRIGGTEGRIKDERIALDLGVLGQETTGPGGLAYALRTLPHARFLAERVAQCAPEAMRHQLHQPRGHRHRGHGARCWGRRSWGSATPRSGSCAGRWRRSAPPRMRSTSTTWA